MGAVGLTLGPCTDNARKLEVKAGSSAALVRYRVQLRCCALRSPATVSGVDRFQHPRRPNNCFWQGSWFEVADGTGTQRISFKYLTTDQGGGDFDNSAEAWANFLQQAQSGLELEHAAEAVRC